MNYIFSYAFMWLAFAYTWDKRLVYEDLWQDGFESTWNALIHIIYFESDEMMANIHICELEVDGYFECNTRTVSCVDASEFEYMNFNRHVQLIW